MLQREGCRIFIECGTDKSRYKFLNEKNSAIKLPSIIACGMHHWGCRELVIGVAYTLLIEPNNPKDKYAVAVMDGDRRRAYITRDQARKLSYIMDTTNIVGKIYIKFHYPAEVQSNRIGPDRKGMLASISMASRNYTQTDLTSALTAVRNGALSIREAAKTFLVPKLTLADRVSGRVKDGARLGKSTTFSPEDESFLKNQTIERFVFGVVFLRRNFMRAAEIPSEKWHANFKQRHPSLSLRSPEATAASRHIAMTRERIAQYFSTLKVIMDENDF
ncbi:hypothetical protein KUTeg_017208 [Tegillarca granosa]|uniref:HTH psq-type domain-containing protein n=1 Tax=Tegillarca granosa TaxID=220873 RepID=A0ABQ9EIW4_TEGGR|nr:hypothetical protein KUTeg_017208 [Tegillarca granosa]